MLEDDAGVMNAETTDNDRRYFSGIGMYDTKSQLLDSGLCYNERVVGVPRKRRGRKGSSGGIDQCVIIIQTRTIKSKCVQQHN